MKCPAVKGWQGAPSLLTVADNELTTMCVVRRVSDKAEPSATARSSATTSRVRLPFTSSGGSPPRPAGITKPATRRLALPGGVKCSRPIYEETRASTTYTGHAKRHVLFFPARPRR
ncbi:hypothetical protein MKEN_00640300 [Mycena kentingensis (nom. inval.)]|nr:hypothetical protein MKEN_00640300 [Mycena kentingensis (nom. inval.)]